jgi:hypothetical protein
MTLRSRLDRGDFRPGITIIPEAIRRAMLMRLEEGGNVAEWVRRALTNRLPAQVAA